MIGGPLERSLPVVNGEFFQKLGRLGPLERSLPVVNWDLNGFFKNWDDGEPLERPLPVVNWDFNGFLQKLGWLGSLERSLPVVSVLRGCDGRSLLERSLYQVASVLRNTDHPNF